jgi:hypothetical protein
MSGVAGSVGVPAAGTGQVSGPVTPARRVRHDVRDGLVVMAFSAVASVALAVLLLLASEVLVGLGR